MCNPELGDASQVPLNIYHATPCVMEILIIFLTNQLRLKTFVASHVQASKLEAIENRNKVRIDFRTFEIQIILNSYYEQDPVGKSFKLFF